jgi:hypothetical protein
MPILKCINNCQELLVMHFILNFSKRKVMRMETNLWWKKSSYIICENTTSSVKSQASFSKINGLKELALIHWGYHKWNIQKLENNITFGSPCVKGWLLWTKQVQGNNAQWIDNKKNIYRKTLIVINRNSGNLIHYKKLNMYCLTKNIIKSCFKYLLIWPIHQAFLKHTNKFDSTRCWRPQVKLIGKGLIGVSHAHHKVWT